MKEFFGIVWILSGLVAVFREGNPFKGLEKAQGWEALGEFLFGLFGLAICVVLGPFAFLVMIVVKNDHSQGE